MTIYKTLLSITFSLFLFAPLAHALDLQEAKHAGLVGEQANGYLGAPGEKVSAEVSALIQDINAKRKQKYREIAKKVGKSLTVVEKLAGEKAQSKTKPGHYIRDAGGRWSKQ